MDPAHDDATEDKVLVNVNDEENKICVKEEHAPVTEDNLNVVEDDIQAEESEGNGQDGNQIAIEAPTQGVPRRSQRDVKYSSKMLEYREEGFLKRERKLKQFYEQWRNTVRIIRKALKVECNETDLGDMIDDVKYVESAVLKSFEDLRAYTALTSMTKDLVRKMDACVAVTKDMLNILNERLCELDEFNPAVEQRRLRTLKDKDYAKSIFSSITEESSTSTQSKSSTESKISEKMAEVAVDLAARRAEYDMLPEVEAQRSILTAQQSELKKLEIKQEIEVANARLNAYSNIMSRTPGINGVSSRSKQESALPHLSSVKQEPVPQSVLNANAKVFQARAPMLETPVAQEQSYPVTRTTGHPHVMPKIQQRELTEQASQLTETPASSGDYSILAQALAEAVNLNRLPVPEPNVFTGDPLEYIEWNTSFQMLIERKGIPAQEKIFYLKKYVGGPVQKALEGYFYTNSQSAFENARQVLDERYGHHFVLQKAFRDKLAKWPKIDAKDPIALRGYGDFLQSCRDATTHVPSLSILSDCIENQKLMSKLPDWAASRWNRQASQTLTANNVYPSFEQFVDFVVKEARVACNPISSPYALYDCEKQSAQKAPGRPNPRQVSQQTQSRQSAKKTWEASPAVIARKTETLSVCDSFNCPLHKNGKHHLNDCVMFRQKPISERKKIILTSGICFRCCSGKKHRAKNCTVETKCEICHTSSHPTALHEEAKDTDLERHKDVKLHGGERSTENVVSACTQICGLSKSCAKIVPVRVYHESDPDNVMLVYATIDDQSNRSLATTPLFDHFGERSQDVPYTLVSCSGTTSAAGRLGKGYIVQSLDGSCELRLPDLIECNDLPCNRDEIPSCQIASQYPHLQRISSMIPPLMESAGMDLLIGRDITSAHIVQEQIVGEENQPFAQRLALGWVIVGEVCLGGAHVPDVKVFKTFVLSNGRHSNFQPCDSEISVHEQLFVKTDHDEEVGLSVEDREFLAVMDSSFEKDDDGHWVAPLPFKRRQSVLPNNKLQALRRARSFDTSLRRNPLKYEHVREFMQRIFDRGHAEKAPDLSSSAERWYLPMFAVYHPKKPEAIRVVFDSSASCEGTSLNDSLLKGPDLSNSLQGVLMRFRQEKFAVMADVEQMFHNFRVQKGHRDFLRFLWHSDNNLESPLEEFRMTVHVFGNSPSPAVATYGLRRSVLSADADVQDFVSNNFYVDDGLLSFPETDQAVDLIKRTQLALYDGGRLRLHKIASNSKAILREFPKEDLAKNLKDINIGQDDLPEQRSLGISWDIEADTFTFHVNPNSKPFTRRGVLSVVNSLFDPIGFTAPVTLEGKLLLREAMSTKCDWDEPLSEGFKIDWDKWVESLNALQDLNHPRMYCSLSVEKSPRIEVHVFADASKEAVAAVAFIRVFSDRLSDVGFLCGKAKVAPTHGHTIPRLELCTAVLAVEIAETIREQLNVKKNVFRFYTDSRVVLGYIANESRRFHVYVANRVSRIRSFVGPESWSHVATEQNPADVGTRGCSARDLPNSMWILGPSFLHDDFEIVTPTTVHDLIDTETDVEVRKKVNCVKTVVTPFQLGSKRFQRFSTWSSLVRALVCLRRFLAKKSSVKLSSVLQTENVERFIIKHVQRDMYPSEIHAISCGKGQPKNSPLLSLNPVLDPHGVLRVGGRIKRIEGPATYDAPVSTQPIVIPKNHHLAVLLVRHFHAKIHHQGRHLTDGAIRSGGFWIIGARRLINSTIQKCVTCKKLRGNFGWTQMAELPLDRIEPGPPFTFVGIDVFGPWPIVVRRTTRGVATTAKRWAVLFTCLVSRGVHIKLVEEMSSASFINALRRFLAIRGPVRQFRSDRGSNFVGAVNEIGISASYVEDEAVNQFLTKNGTTWIFNPPHAHHFGGAWERMIGVCRRILDALLLENRSKDLTHEILSTFMAEVCAIMNARPLLPVSSDPEAPSTLTPSMLLTQKTPDPNGTKDVTGFGSKDAIKSQWKLVQRLADEFWRRWRSEYLHNLQVRPKWQSPGYSFKERDVVLVKDDSCHRNFWPLGVVEDIYPSSDSIVRKVKVRVTRGDAHTTYVRPISDLVRLAEFE